MLHSFKKIQKSKTNSLCKVAKLEFLDDYQTLDAYFILFQIPLKVLVWPPSR